MASVPLEINSFQTVIQLLDYLENRTSPTPAKLPLLIQIPPTEIVEIGLRRGSKPTRKIIPSHSLLVYNIVDLQKVFKIVLSFSQLKKWFENVNLPMTESPISNNRYRCSPNDLFFSINAERIQVIQRDCFTLYGEKINNSHAVYINLLENQILQWKIKRDWRNQGEILPKPEDLAVINAKNTCLMLKNVRIALDPVIRVKKVFESALVPLNAHLPAPLIRLINTYLENDIILNFETLEDAEETLEKIIH